MSDTAPKAKPPFRMIIEEIAIVKGHGVVIGGKVEEGTLQENDRILILDQRKTIQATVGVFLMPFMRSSKDFVAWPGDNIAFALHSAERDQLTPGMIITTEGL